VSQRADPFFIDYPGALSVTVSPVSITGLLYNTLTIPTRRRLDRRPISHLRRDDALRRRLNSAAHPFRVLRPQHHHADAGGGTRRAAAAGGGYGGGGGYNPPGGGLTNFP
jgi:hypothetical protein